MNIQLETEDGHIQVSIGYHGNVTITNEPADADKVTINIDEKEIALRFFRSIVAALEFTRHLSIIN